MHYKLEGAGWASLIITPAGGKEILVSDLSYLDEPLWDLLRVGLDCALRAPPRNLVFNNEGRFTRMTFQVGVCEEPPEPLPMDVVIEVTDPTRTESPSPDGWRLLGSFKTHSEELAGALLACGEDVLARYGIEGYDREWIDMGFPLRSLLALRAALSIDDPVGAKYRFSEADVLDLRDP